MQLYVDNVYKKIAIPYQINNLRHNFQAQELNGFIWSMNTNVVQLCPLKLMKSKGQNKQNTFFQLGNTKNNINSIR